MALREREQPPAYSREDKSPLGLPPSLPDGLHADSKGPSLEPLHLLDTSPTKIGGASPQHIGTAQLPIHTLNTPSVTALQTAQLPSVPQQDPGQRASPTETGSAMSVDTKRSASMEDPDDRMAAEALCGLGKVESRPTARPAPSGYETPLKYYPIDIEHTRSAAANGDAEPLLSLLTSSHPWLGGTINGSLSAYSSTKSHSPRFIQYGADFVERNIGSPVASTVGSVSRKTGVEGGLRRYLDSRRPGDAERIDPNLSSQEGSSKRRRISVDPEDDSQMGYSPQRTLTGHASMETLPLYDENRSPAYEDRDSSQLAQQHRRPSMPRSWSTQLMISTSGLGAALNETSLRSLKFVLGLLRNANLHVTELMAALKRVLLECDTGSIRLEEGQMLSEKTDSMHLDNQAAQGTVAERIKQLNDQIWHTLRGVVTAVSRYTGGALPENASAIVRWQLMSVPRRWQRAMSSQPKGDEVAGEEKEAVTSAHRMLAFAVEGIDMMEQVGGVVDSTIASAEKWLASLGMKNKQVAGAAPATGAGAAGDEAAEMKHAGDAHMSGTSPLQPGQEAP